MEYKDYVLQRIAHTEGAVTRQVYAPTGAVSYNHEYVLRDHLGNARVTFTDGISRGDAYFDWNTWTYNDPNVGNTGYNDGVITQDDITQINNYYPFGLNMEGNWNGSFPEAKNKYQYNEKELNVDFGLNWNDHGARNYDPSIGRWCGADRFSSAYVTSSPYAYVENNPVRYMDINGLFKWPAEYYIKYPKLTAYLQNNIQQDILNSPAIMAGFLKHSGGNLTAAKVHEITEWDSGPKIRLSETPGDSKIFGKEPQGFYDRFKTKDIIINTRLADQLENASDEERQSALIAIYKTILHETTHYGDYLDGEGMLDKNMDYIEAGNAFDNDVFWGTEFGFNAKFADTEGISTIKRANEWKAWIAKERVQTWMQLIPRIPAQYRPKQAVVNPLPTLQPKIIPRGA